MQVVYPILLVCLICFSNFELVFSATATKSPSLKPTVKPTVKPSLSPALSPTFKPSLKPTIKPTIKPTLKPTLKPTIAPSILPTSVPTTLPTSKPTSKPSTKPTNKPTNKPTSRPTSIPSIIPTSIPTIIPTSHPSHRMPPHGLSPGGVAGIVIAIIFVLGAISLYIYRNHLYYIKRFVTIHVRGYGGISKNTDEDDDDLELNSASHKSGRVRTYTATNPINPDTEDAEDTDGIQNIEISNGLLKSGYLNKQATNVQKSWLKRWFFIKEGSMYYSKKPIDPATLSKHELIPAVLVANFVISTIKVINETEFQIISPGVRGVGTGGGIYTLSADDPTDCADWIRIIKEQIAGNLTASLSAANDEEQLTLSSTKYFIPNRKTLQIIGKSNPTCIDCGKASPEWASINLCIVVCIECSGVHRSMGSHISKVRSLTLDKWNKNLIELLVVLGNENLKGILDSNYLDHCNMDKEEYIHNKYINKLYKPPMTKYEETQLTYDFLFSAYSGDYYNLMRTLLYGVNINIMMTNSSEIPITVVPPKKTVNATSSDHISKKLDATSQDVALSWINHGIVVNNNDMSSSNVDGFSTPPMIVLNIEEMRKKLLNKTAIMLAACQGHVLCVELLCQWNADMNVVTPNETRSIYDLIQQENTTNPDEIREILKSHS